MEAIRDRRRDGWRPKARGLRERSAAMRPALPPASSASVALSLCGESTPCLAGPMEFRQACQASLHLAAVAEPPHLRAVPAHFHIAPPFRAVLRRVEEEPLTGVGGARAHAGDRLGR